MIFQIKGWKTYYQQGNAVKSFITFVYGQYGQSFKVYKNDQLLMNYSGITFDWKGSYTGSLIRIGVYRDSDPSGKGYPPQSIHYDDFTIVSDKKTLDKYLN